MANQLEEGRYFCRVNSQEVRLSRNENWMVVLGVTPILFDPGGKEEKVAIEEDRLEGHKLTAFLTLTTKSAPIVVRELRAIGYTGENPAELHRAEGEHDLTDKEAWFTLKWRDSNDGKDPFESWRPETTREAAAPSVVTDEQLAQLNATFGTVFAAGSGETAEVSRSEWTNEL